MDILSARKKAAAKKKARDRKAEEEQQAPLPAAPAEPAPEPEQAAAAAEPQGTPAPAPQAGEPPTGVQEPEPQEEQPEAVPVIEEVELLAFRIGGEAYAVLVEQTREVLKLWETTAVPHTPAYVLGVMSIRGAVLPVIDLSQRLGLGPGDRGERSRVIVVSIGNEETGLLVERVTGVVRIRPDEIRPAPETAEQGPEAEFLQGIARKNDVLYILLELKKVLG